MVSAFQLFRVRGEYSLYMIMYKKNIRNIDFTCYQVDGIVPNEYETPTTLAHHLFRWFKNHWKNWYRLSMRRDIVPEEETVVFASEEHSKRHIKYKRKKES